MKLKTFFCENMVGGNFVVVGDELNHLVNVYRLRVGDEVRIISGGENEFFCRISELSKKESICGILRKQKCKANPKKKLTVYVCTLKQDKNEFAVEKLTEIGASEVVFVNSENVSRLNKINLERLKKIAVSASKQCGRSDLIKIRTDVKFEEMLKEVGSYNGFYVAYECERMVRAPKRTDKQNNIAILIGSEGGFAEHEIEKLKLAGATSFSLGKRILRAETAVVAAATLFLNEMGEV